MRTLRKRARVLKGVVTCMWLVHAACTVDFNNAISHTILSAAVINDGKDLIMTMRFDGVFAERSKILRAIKLT